MARISNKPALATYYRIAAWPRTIPVSDPQRYREIQWPINIGRITVQARDAETVIFIPKTDNWDEDGADEPDALWRGDAEAFDCFKTSYAYEMIDEEHPRIVPILGQDPWTGLPILPRPSGGSLENFLTKYESQLYTPPTDSGFQESRRLKPEFLPLAYQWGLQLLSAMSLIHSHNIAYGEILDSTCWISAPFLSISLAGFLGSAFSHPTNGKSCPGFFFSGIEFSPEFSPSSRSSSVPTSKTDMFMFGRILYQIIASTLPGEGMGRDYGETQTLLRNQDWQPDIEDEFMGAILHKCWRFEYEDVYELQREVEGFIESRGWSIRGDELEGLDLNSIHRQLEGNAGCKVVDLPACDNRTFVD